MCTAHIIISMDNLITNRTHYFENEEILIIGQHMKVT